MKPVTTIVLASFIGILINSCNKDAAKSKNAATAISGKWNIVNDSSYLEGASTVQPVHSNYIGSATDYYNFTPDGNLYIKEGAASDTATYTLTGNNEVKIFYLTFDEVSFGANGGTKGNFIITNLTEHTMTLTLPEAITPGGKTFQLINLKK